MTETWEFILLGIGIAIIVIFEIVLDIKASEKYYDDWE